MLPLDMLLSHSEQHVMCAVLPQGSDSTFGNGINLPVQALKRRVDQTAELAPNPMLGIEQIHSMFDQTFQAMDAMDNFRSKAISTLGANNKLVEAQLQRADSYVDRTRQQQARAAVAAQSTELKPRHPLYA